MSLVLLLISLSLVLMFAWRVYIGCDTYVTAKLNLFKVKNVPKNFPARAIKLGTVMVAKATEQVHQTFTGTRFGRSLTNKRMEGKVHQKSMLEEITETPIEGTSSGCVMVQSTATTNTDTKPKTDDNKETVISSKTDNNNV